MDSNVLIFVAACAIAFIVRWGPTPAIVGASASCLVAVVWEGFFNTALPTPILLSIAACIAIILIWHDLRSSHVQSSIIHWWVVGLVAIGFVFTLQALRERPSMWTSFIAAEDNEGWISRMVGKFDGRVISTPFSSQGIGPLSRFILDVMAMGAETPADFGWRLFCLWLFAVFATAIASARVARAFTPPASTPFLVVASSLCAACLGVWGSMQFLRSGHFSFQVAIIGCLAHLEYLSTRGRDAPKFVFRFSALCGGLAIGLAYIPFYPLGILIAFVSSTDLSFYLIKRLRSASVAVSVILFAVTFIGVFWGVREFISRYAEALDVGGGTASVRAPFLVAIAIGLLPWVPDRKFFERRGIYKNTIIVISAFLAITLAAVPDLSIGQRQWHGVGLIVGTLIAASKFDGFVGRLSANLANRSYFNTIVYLCIFICFTSLIYFVSIATGEIHHPMYAAQKTLLGLGVLLLPIAISRLLQIGLDSNHWHEITRFATIFIATAVIVGAVPFPRYSELQNQWWMSEVFAGHRERDKTFVACVEGDVSLVSHETYTCNRFMQALGPDSGLSNAFRYFAWYGSKSTDALTESVESSGLFDSMVLLVHGEAGETVDALVSRWQSHGVSVEVIEVGAQ